MSFQRFHPPMDNRDGPPGLFHPPGFTFSGDRLQPPGLPFTTFSGDRLQPPGLPFSGDRLQPPGLPFSGDRLQPPCFPFSGDRLQPPGFPFSGDRLQPPGFPFSGDRLQPPGLPFSGDRLQPPGLPFSGDCLQPPGLPFSGDRLQPPGLPFSGDRLQPPDLPFSGDRLQPPGFPFRGSQPVLFPERGLSESVRIGPSLWLYNKQQEQGDIPRPQHPFDSCVTQNGSERQKLLQDLSQKQIKLASLRTEMAKLVMGQNDSMQQTGVVNSNLPRLIEIETALASLTKEVGRLLRASFRAPHHEKIDVPEKTLDRKPPFMDQKPLVKENPPRPNAGNVGARAAVGQWGLPPTYNQSYDQHSRGSHGQASVDKTYSSFTSKVGDRKSQATNDADRKHKRGYSKSSNKQHSSSSRDVRKSFRDRHPRIDRNSSRDRHHRDDRDISCDSYSWNGDEQKSTKQRKDDDWEAGKLAKQNIDALLQDEQLKNILFAFVEMSKATAKLEQSLKTTYKKCENDATTDDSFSRHEAQQSAQTSPADVSLKPKSILKREKRVDVETVEEGVNVESQVSSDPFSKLSGLWKASFKPVGAISQLESCDDSDSGDDGDPGDSRGQARVDSTVSSFNSKAGDRIFPATDDADPKHQRGYSKSSDKQRSSSSPDDQMNSSYGHPSENLASSHDSYPHDDPTTFYGSHSQGREPMSSLKKKPEERVDAESKTSSVPAGKGNGKDSTFPDIWGLLYEQFRQPINNPSKVWQATSNEQDASTLDHLFQAPRHAHNHASSSQTKKAGDDDEELDSTVQDILQSIEFKTALSKQDVLHTGMIKQSASFLEHRSRSRSSDRRRSRSPDRRRSRSPDRRRSRSPDRRRSRSVKRHTPRREARLKGSRSPHRVRSRSPGRHRSQSSSQSRSRSTDRRRSRSPRGQPSRARSPERHGSHHFLIQRNVSTSLKLHIDDTIIRY